MSLRRLPNGDVEISASIGWFCSEPLATRVGFCGWLVVRVDSPSAAAAFWEEIVAIVVAVGLKRRSLIEVII
jgi:hypothetical protein